MIINVIGFSLYKTKKACMIAAKTSLNHKKLPNVELTIKFVSPKEIQRLNKEFRNIDKVTDVLSFPATNTVAGQPVEGGDGVYLGDMAICLKQAKQQAKEYGVSYLSEVQKLVVHSVLHLLGYDHIQDTDFEIMNKEEERIINLLKGE